MLQSQCFEYLEYSKRNLNIGLHPDLERVLGWMQYEAQKLGIEGPIPISTCRTREEQAEMQKQWDLGNREGMAARPADDSLHIPDETGSCRAFDLGNSISWLQIMGPKTVSEFPFLRWGGNFFQKDYPHFDMEKVSGFVIQLN